MRIEFSGKPLNYISSDIDRVNRIWHHKTTQEEKERGLNGAGFSCGVGGTTHMIRKAALRYLGKIK